MRNLNPPKSPGTYTPQAFPTFNLIKSPNTMTIRASPLVFIITIFLCFISNLFSRQAGLASAECPLASPKPIVFPLANCSIQPNENYQDLLTSWGLEIQAGSQYFCVVPTLVSNNTILFDTDICTTEDTSTFAQCT